MKTYTTRTPRATLGLAAVALSALTIGLMVGAPAHSHQGAAARLAPQHRALPVAPPIEVAISPARIDVVATRADFAIAAQTSDVAFKAKAEGYRT
jgi:hypothetical protein